jgi:lysophospholipase L1-like esterase
MRPWCVSVAFALLSFSWACQARKSDPGVSQKRPLESARGTESDPKAARSRSDLEKGPDAKPSPNSRARAEPGSSVARARVYRVAALGDSITDESVGGGKYLDFLRRACPESSFYHFGKGGDMTNQMRRRLHADLLPEVSKLRLDTLIVLGGVNDLYSNLTAGRSNPKIEDDLRQIYQTAKDNGLRVVAVTVLPWGGFRKYFSPERADNTRALNSFILGLVGQGVDVAVDGYSLLSCGHPEELCPAYELKRPDGLHPGLEGHRILGKALQAEAFSDCR